mgnify:CR=1 FL=1
MDNHNIFLASINEKKVVKVKINSYEKGIIIRKCIPFDFGPSRKYKDGENRYHFYDLDSPDGSHTLSILPHQLREIEILNETFNPGDYVNWTPKWFVKRDWGQYS